MRRYTNRCNVRSPIFDEIRHESEVSRRSHRESVILRGPLNTHKKNEEWLARHPLVTFHYTPTRASWLNQVEGWFSILQGQSLTGASFTSVEQLKKHIDAFIESYNEDAEPFVWTKSKVHQRRVKGRRLSDL